MSISSFFARHTTINFLKNSLKTLKFFTLFQKTGESVVMIKKPAFTSFCAFLVFARTSYGDLSLYEQARLIKSLSNYLNCKSVLILSSNSDGINHLLLLEKMLNNPPQFYTGIWNYTTFIRYLYSDRVFYFKTLIFMEENILNLKNLALVSKTTSLASSDWLIMSKRPLISESNFKNIVIPINCRFFVSTAKENDSVQLHEMYKISRNSKLIQNNFAKWSLKDGLCGLKEDLFNRRRDLKGHQFKFAVHNLSHGINPCKAIHIDNGKQMIQCAYFDVWRNLQEILNYTTKYVIIEDCYKNGSTGLSTPMLEMIRTGGADSGEDGYIWSSPRLIYNQFFWPLFHSKVILVTKIPSRNFSFSSYVRPFDENMWLALVSWLLLSGLIITFTKFITTKYFHVECPVPNDNTENLILPLAAICYQGSPFPPQKTAIRISYLMIYLIPVLLIPSYSGSIISSLSVPSENIPFNNLDEFEKDGTYQLNAINNTFFQVFLATDETFETLRQKKLISTTMTVSYEQSFQDICSKRVTFIYEWPLMTRHSVNCNVFKFYLSLKQIFSSMAVRKNFPYLELFNRQMQKLILSGLSMKILEKNTLKLFKHEINPFPQNYYQIKPFGFEEVLPSFAVLAAGILLSLFIFFLERQGAKEKKFQ